ncbi:DJ-1/PfpI family protein, partial [Candidatus Peregrinibacteria bacterium]|nr:DJ-1/PfpI family protein [Candidatus Peregrinibacteria bacterium]
AQNGFQDIELEGTRRGLLDAGFDIALASHDASECIGKFGAKERAKLSLRDVHVKDFDRIAFIGGPGARTLIDSKNAHRIARETVEAKKPLGAICIAPMILASAGVLRGKHATVWNEDGGQAGFLRAQGAVYEARSVVRDGLILTANGPAASEEFGHAFAMLGEVIETI